MSSSRPALLARLLIGAVDLYQHTIGATHPPACRFFPTCSEYAKAAIRQHGMVRGAVLATRRLLRCRPFGQAGFDPVR